MNLDESRRRIDDIDNSLIKLFEERMNIVKDIAAYKKQKNMPVFHRGRERDIINRLSLQISPEMRVYTKMLYNTIFEISRSYQSKMLEEMSKTAKKIKASLEKDLKLLPQNAIVACQGTEGAYSQIAAERVFSNPSVIYFNNFKGVFEAVKQGMCNYGVLPIENSIHGSVSEVSDLMCEYGFFEVKGVRVQINHVLLAKKNTKEIHEIFSHSQAIGQCERFLKDLKGVKITVVENTAVAAKMVAESERDDVASISSELCAELYGLNVIKSGIADSDNNYTRFAVISSKPEIYPGADKISVMLRLKHEPGSLYRIISKFSTVGVNLTKIESRPICGLDFEFRFLLDMNTSVYSEDFLNLITELENASEDFAFLGAYTEN